MIKTGEYAALSYTPNGINKIGYSGLTFQESIRLARVQIKVSTIPESNRFFDVKPGPGNQIT